MREIDRNRLIHRSILLADKANDTLAHFAQEERPTSVEREKAESLIAQYVGLSKLYSDLYSITYEAPQEESPSLTTAEKSRPNTNPEFRTPYHYVLRESGEVEAFVNKKASKSLTGDVLEARHYFIDHIVPGAYPLIYNESGILDFDYDTPEDSHG